MKKALLLGLTTIVMALPFTAANAAKTGGYMGLGLGISNLDAPKITDTDATSEKHEQGGLGGRLFAGYNFNEYLGLEAGVAKYANTEDKLSNSFASVNITRKMTALDLVGKAYLPFANSFNAYALAGVAYVYSKLEGSASNILGDSLEESETTKKLRPKFGAGVSYDINSTWTTSLEATRIQGSGNLKTRASAIPDANMLALNIAYNG